MECSCTIDCDMDEGATLNIDAWHKVAENPIECTECDRMIGAGEIYLKEVGDDIEGNLYYFSTCEDCESIREQFFHNFFYECILDDLHTFLDEGDGTIHEECIANLTPRAQKIVCGYIEDIWRRLEEIWEDAKREREVE